MPEPQETHGGADFLATKLAAAATPQPDRRALVPPSIGRIVHFVLDSGPNAGQHRPAIIVRTWGDTPNAPVNLLVFLDGENDVQNHQGPALLWRTSVPADHSPTPANRTFHWPEFVT